MFRHKDLGWEIKISFLRVVLIAILFQMYGCGTSGSGEVVVPSNPNVVSYSNFNSPEGIAVDANGNIWVTNAGSLTATLPNGTTVTELVKSAGYAPQTYEGMNGPLGIAIDNSGNVWISNTGGSFVIELIAPAYTTSNTFSGSTYFSYPEGIAADGNGNIWVTNGALTTSGTIGTSVTKIIAGSNSCSLATCIVFSDINYFQAPVGIAADNKGNVWVANNGAISNPTTYPGGVTEITNSATTSCTVSTCLVFSNPPTIAGANGIAVDPLGNVWATIGVNEGTNPLSIGTSVVEILAGTASCTPASCLVFSNPEYFNGPFGIAADGAGNMWVASGVPTNDGPIQMITEIKAGATSCTLTTCAIYSASSYLLNNPSLLAIDGSGNVWITNPGYAGINIGSTVIEFKEMAIPATTPIL